MLDLSRRSSAPFCWHVSPEAGIPDHVIAGPDGIHKKVWSTESRLTCFHSKSWASQICLMAPPGSPGDSNGALPSRSSLQVRAPLYRAHRYPAHLRPVVGVGSYLQASLRSVLPPLGITTDLLVYSIIIPVMPFQLERLGYHNVSALTGWLLCAYVRPPTPALYPLTQLPTVRRAGPMYVPHLIFFPPSSSKRQPQYPSQYLQKRAPPAVPPSSLVSSPS
jgi:hypothetical protein